MTTAVDVFSTRSGVVPGDTDEAARRAVKAFRAMQPALSAYARVLTGRQNVRVEMSGTNNGATDGTKIYFRPPIALGADVKHERRLCDRRDSNQQLLCPACLVREDVLVVIYHEIAHICFNSFEEVSEVDAAQLVSKAIAESGTKYAKEIEARIKAAPAYVTSSYIGISGLVSEYLPLLVNALEDARINRELFAARKGTKPMFDSNTRRIFENGVEQVDPATGEVVTVPWNEYPQNMQVLVGIFCKASGYDYSNWFIPQVVEALDDRDLTRLVNKLATVRKASGVYHLAFPVLARLRELGFCQLPDDPEDEPEVEPETEPDDEDTGGDDDTSGDPDDAGSESEAGSGSPDDGPGAGDAGDEQAREDEGEGDDAEGSGGAPDDDTDSDPAGGGDDLSSEEDTEADGDEEAADGADDVSDDGAQDGSEPGAGADEQPGDLDNDGDGSDVDEVAPDGGSSDAGASDDDAAGDDGMEGADGLNEAPSEDDGALGGDQPAGDHEANASSSSGQGTGGFDSDTDSTGMDDAEADADADAGDASDGDADTGAAAPESDAGAEASSEDDDELIDTGADDGEGGVTVIEPNGPAGAPEMGTPEDAKMGLLKWGDHDPKPASIEAQAAEEAVDRAIVQGLYFESPSRRVHGVREHYYGKPIFIEAFGRQHNLSRGWDRDAMTIFGYSHTSLGVDGDFEPAESILGPALLRMRVAFSDNARGHHQRNLKAGKINARALGKRAPAGDPRMFRKKTLPGKKDYFVLIGIDVSGSTVGTNIVLIKQAAMAQAQLCARMGIKFAVYAHSGNYHYGANGSTSQAVDLDIYHIKDPDEPWDVNTQNRLREIGPDSANLDGHTIEYYRRICDQRTETDKVILYYTDGKMPAENHDEELEILQREIRTCRTKGYTLLGVGIRTDSPARHGLDTVQIDEPTDVPKVVKHLEKRLLQP